MVDYLKNHRQYIKDISRGRCIFTESGILRLQLAAIGCNNARYLPNCRKGDKARFPRPAGDVVHFVYFAQVRPEKGIVTLLDAAVLLNHAGLRDRYDISVYGSIVDGFSGEFDSLLKRVPNVNYKGAFDSSKADVFAVLNQYDAAVSSSWMEGMSGPNNECKFAGVANIVSNAGLIPSA